MNESDHKPGLVLPGGGARAAYQVGVLRAIAERTEPGRNPFPVITGMSAGSINAAMLAGYGNQFGAAVNHLTGLWENLTVDKVFRTDVRTMLGTSLRWLAWFLAGRGLQSAPLSLLDNQPLRALLETHLRFPRIQQAIDAGALDALGISASGYTSARSVTFFQGRKGLVSWSRTRRDGRMADIDLDHLMASIAIPLIFPAVRLGPEYYGDGSMRQAAPLSPAIHLGANRLLVIGVRNEEPNLLPPAGMAPDYPSFGQIIGYVLDTLFMDSIYTDVERLRRVNHLLRRATPAKGHQAGAHLREIDVSILVPSEDVRDIVSRHVKRFPRTVRTLLRILGARDARSSQFISYLLFDGNYCGELMELGYHDGVRHAEILDTIIRREAPSQ